MGYRRHGECGYRSSASAEIDLFELSLQGSPVITKYITTAFPDDRSVLCTNSQLVSQAKGSRSTHSTRVIRTRLGTDSRYVCMYSCTSWADLPVHSRVMHAIESLRRALGAQSVEGGEDHRWRQSLYRGCLIPIIPASRVLARAMPIAPFSSRPWPPGSAAPGISRDVTHPECRRQRALGEPGGGGTRGPRGFCHWKRETPHPSPRSLPVDGFNGGSISVPPPSPDLWRQDGYSRLYTESVLVRPGGTVHTLTPLGAEDFLPDCAPVPSPE